VGEVFFGSFTVSAAALGCGFICFFVFLLCFGIRWIDVCCEFFIEGPFSGPGSWIIDHGNSELAAGSWRLSLPLSLR
jgi:hypothetical protein